MASKPSGSELQPVVQKATTLRILTEQLHKDLKIDMAIEEAFSEELNSKDPLLFLQDTLKVLEAQATKLGLLLSNKPFTPSAIITILNDLETRVLVSMYTCACYLIGRKEMYGDIFADIVITRVKGALESIDPLCEMVLSVANDPEKVDVDAVMLVVGKVFAACTALKDMITRGVSGVLFHHAKDFIGLMEDGLEELKEWRDDVDDSTQSEDDDIASEKAREEALEELSGGLSFPEPKQLPGYRTDLVELLAEALYRIDLAIKLCVAVSKRRIRKYPFQHIASVDKEKELAQQKSIAKLVANLRQIEWIQAEVDDVAAAFYDLDAQAIRRMLAKFTESAQEVADGMRLNWDGTEDECSIWVDTWKRLMIKNKIPARPLSE